MACLPVLALLGSCAAQAPASSALPSIYLPLANNSAHIDVEAARDMISSYRRNRGAAPLASIGVAALAEAEAASMALAIGRARRRPSRPRWSGSATRT